MRSLSRMVVATLLVAAISAPAPAAVLPRSFEASLKRLQHWLSPHSRKKKSSSKDAWQFESTYLRLYKRLLDLQDLRRSRVADKKEKAKLLKRQKRELLTDFEAFLDKIEDYEKTHERIMVDDLTTPRVDIWPIPQIHKRLDKLRKQSTKARWDKAERSSKVPMSGALEQWLPSLRLPEGPDFRDAKDRLKAFVKKLDWRKGAK